METGQGEDELDSALGLAEKGDIVDVVESERRVRRGHGPLKLHRAPIEFLRATSHEAIFGLMR